ncbi:ABC-type branched-subunit amino acid transport system substrate-binding protein [Pseudomonas fluvialis]|uniref:ABC-type branched-subunit amino acid transport system substrate-binding protein n=1 Tax=Pseudomonas fluvialis TaxID=1793966 RepID=A0A7X0BNV8_9PSED|nr:ABC transporter substrate-binding protein [Pseudomonas fluvialis]MBB6340030.1 ABC-type branched-subunit amino acid transport system substrate-binding protein [Pseudomonas fluvialis]
MLSVFRHTLPRHRPGLAVGRWLAAALLSALVVGGLRAEDGVSDDEVRLGMVNAQSGPAAGLGKGLHAGALAYFARVNSAGGVHGRRVSLLLRDDSYEPARTAEQTRQLITSGAVFALFGYVGTPTSRAAMPIALQAEVPYLFPFTGAEVLRKPVHPWVFNVRASYFDETEAMVERMTRDLGLSKVALLMQDDSFGETVKSGLAGALHRRELKIHGEARVQRNSLDVAAAVAELKRSQPEAIFFVGTYKQLAAAIRQARVSGLDARFFTVSFVGTDNFITEAGLAGDGVHISQVVPSPQDRTSALIRQYQADVAAADIGYASLEGYIDAAVFVAALREAGPQPTRASLVQALAFLQIDLAGFPVAFSPSNHQGSDAVFITRVAAGQAVPVDRLR